ncbi:unnamed protein product [Prunus armeniaca]|uniref:Uncharacterized protein n=1 Tax=Prunus armeniaca TaxID=36596 RepID=A0A6J5TKZ5_PRUAR|nr:unnamed protein product [Prunus armeniaca]CAB4295007.1 unnamed protein product [Prunus armeniaca]
MDEGYQAEWSIFLLACNVLHETRTSYILVQFGQGYYNLMHPFLLSTGMAPLSSDVGDFAGHKDTSKIVGQTLLISSYNHQYHPVMLDMYL